MRKTLLFLMLLSVKLTFGQVSDAFSDGNFHANPIWTGDAALFFVNSAKQLQTMLNTSSQSVILGTANFYAVNVKWEFLIQLNFDPSASNQAKIYLISDQPNLNGPLNGYFVQIGENGSEDSYDLYRQTGTTVTKIIDGAPSLRTDVNQLIARIRVTRNEFGKWELAIDPTGGNAYRMVGETTDLTYVYTDWFGVSCKYTASRSDGFIFDDFSISELAADVKAPAVLSASVLDEHTVEAVFSERLELVSALQPNNYVLKPLGNPIAVSATHMPNVYRLTFSQTLPSGDYSLILSGVKDLAGNVIGTNNTAIFFYLMPYELKKGDLLISEILVNPKNGGVDFVEIYNATAQILDLKNLQLANADAMGNMANVKNVSSTSVYMPAKTYWVLTADVATVKQQFETRFPNQFIQMAMPAYNNDRGSVILNGSSGVLERFDYTAAMHHPLLRNVDGVALERISFTRSANEIGNFSSATMSAGFATPTYRNSQENNPSIVKNDIYLPNKSFSPDGDGFEDLLQIDYHFVNAGNVVTINIYNDKGLLVRRLQRNATVATEGNFVWDGLSDKGLQSKVGIYIIQFDAFALHGKTESFREACILATKLN